MSDATATKLTPTATDSRLVMTITMTTKEGNNGMVNLIQHEPKLNTQQNNTMVMVVTTRISGKTTAQKIEWATMTHTTIEH